ncbi:hypothetical protein QQF64_033121, partial [Cirrhinus molitorella]
PGCKDGALAGVAAGSESGLHLCTAAKAQGWEQPVLFIVGAFGTRRRLPAADEAPCPLRSGHLGTGCGNQSQPFLAGVRHNPLKLLDTLIRTERESPASCPRCHLGMWWSECILNR